MTKQIDKLIEKYEERLFFLNTIIVVGSVIEQERRLTFNFIQDLKALKQGKIKELE